MSGHLLATKNGFNDKRKNGYQKNNKRPTQLTKTSHQNKLFKENMQVMDKEIDQLCC